jgi:hypothetical protein
MLACRLSLADLRLPGQGTWLPTARPFRPLADEHRHIVLGYWQSAILAFRLLAAELNRLGSGVSEWPHVVSIHSGVVSTIIPSALQSTSLWCSASSPSVQSSVVGSFHCSPVQATPLQASSFHSSLVQSILLWSSQVQVCAVIAANSSHDSLVPPRPVQFRLFCFSPALSLSSTGPGDYSEAQPCSATSQVQPLQFSPASSSP